MTAHIINLTKPQGMTVKDFKAIVNLIEKKRPLLTYAEKQQCQELLKDAGIRQKIMGGSLNFNVAELLKEGKIAITASGKEITELHMKINALPVFLELVLHTDLYEISRKEVEKTSVLSGLKATWIVKMILVFGRKKYGMPQVKFAELF